MTRFFVFVALFAIGFIIANVFGRVIQRFFKTSQSANLEEDLKKGEDAKKTIETLNKKITNQ